MEVLVVVGLLAMISIAIMSSQVNPDTKRESFRQEGDKIATLFQNIRNYAISNTAFDLNNDGNLSVPAGGYGIFIKPETIDGRKTMTFVTFADTFPVNAPNGLYDENQDYLIAESPAYTAPDPIVITELQGDNNDTAQATIIFLPTTADVIINNNIATSYSTLNFKIANPGLITMSFSVNKISKFFNLEYKSI